MSGSDPAAPSAKKLIGGQYAIDAARPLGGAGGGLPAFAVTDRRGRVDLMAVQVQPGLPPRAEALAALTGASVEGVLVPVAHGPAGTAGGQEAYFVVGSAPVGPALGVALRPWSEGELLDCLLRPVVQALDRLQQRGVTHRAIRPDNLFRFGPGQPVVLGSAWAAPPASLQPAVFEPPYSAMCLPEGRGNGSTADDVYALGVTMLTLALGRVPLAGLDDAAILRRKLDRGSFAALAGEERLPGMIGDLVRGMLAEDPDHRPPLALLADPPAARARRVAARPPRRAQRPLELAGEEIWDARALAHAMASHPTEGLQALRDGTADRWLRRGVGDATTATRVEERVRGPSADAGHGAQADASLLMQAVSVLDPLAPLCWRGIAIWPDGLGPALAAAHQGSAEIADRIVEIVEVEAARIWASARPERCDLTMLRVEARQQRATLRMRGGGRPRLLYALNPLQPCTSPLLDGRCVARMQDLLPALEAVSARPDHAGTLPLDPHVAAFIAVRSEEPAGPELFGQGPGAVAAQLRLLAKLQGRFHPHPLPGVAAWLVSASDVLVSTWRNKSRRGELQERLRGLATAGQLAPLLALIDDPGALARDAQGAAQAAQMLARADAELHRLANGAAERAKLARRLGQEIAAGSGLAALVAVLGFAALG
jgi:hypothetical protein